MLLSCQIWIGYHHHWKLDRHHHCKLVKVMTAELGLPSSFILCKVEDELQQLYLQVFKKAFESQSILNASSLVSWPSIFSPCSSWTSTPSPTPSTSTPTIYLFYWSAYSTTSLSLSESFLKPGGQNWMHFNPPLTYMMVSVLLSRLRWHPDGCTHMITYMMTLTYICL